MRSETLFLFFVLATIVVGLSSRTSYRSLHLGRSVIDSGPRSMWLSRHGKGRNLPAGGAIWPTSMYWTRVQVGTPLQSYAVGIDSGSNAIFLTAKGCDGCPTNWPNHPYDPSSSSSSVPAGKNYSYTYWTCDPVHPQVNCTIKGSMYWDSVSLAGFGPAPILLGATDFQTANFYQFQDVDGALGFCKGPSNQSVFETLCADGQFCEPVYGICLHEGTHSNGTLTVGGVDETLADGPIEYVPAPWVDTHVAEVPGTAWQEIDFFNITFGLGSSNAITVENPNATRRAILDTGTNDLVLPTKMFQQTEEGLCSASLNLSHCRSLFSGSCFALSDEEVDAYPPLTIQLDLGVQLHMSSRDYLLKGSPVALPGQYCLGISDGGPWFLIGDSTMQNYYLVFAPGKVGWGKVNKKTCGSIPIPQDEDAH